MSKQTSMYYDEQQDQWMVHVDQKAYPMYCGEHLNLFIGKQGFPCRLELDWSWYVIFPDTRFSLHKNTVYTVQI
jgi:hypothetical protein